MKILTDLLHLLMCQKHHETDMMKLINRHEGKCYYYLESDIAGGELMEDHLHWAMVAGQFKKSYGFNTDEEALEFVKKTIEISRSARELTQGNRLKVDFLMTLLQ